MKKLLALIIIVTFSCVDKNSPEYKYKQLEKLYELRKKQKEKEISEIKEYKYLAADKYVGCDCSEKEREEDDQLYWFLAEFKDMSYPRIMTLMNCGVRINTAKGQEVLQYPADYLNDFIKMQVDKYGFNPYSSPELVGALKNDKTFKKLFPYTIRDFSSYSFQQLTDPIFTYEQFMGFTNPDGPVRIIMPDGIVDPLSMEEITEYNVVIGRIVEDKLFIENDDYYIKCPSRYVNENQTGENEFAWVPCIEDYNPPELFDADSDGDGISDLEEEAFDLDPKLADTDGDGYNDGDEFFKWYTDPLDPESIPTDEALYFFENCEYPY
tara:strand:- start:71 stop:1042 length:972 start_codon:yes stop_codon:yes gene_type:complete